MMKYLLLILFSCLQLSFAQEGYFALITNPQIGQEESANNLIEVVDDINNRESVTNVIVLGNITAGGKFDEFIWAQEILDGLSVPYFIVGGENDYLLSERNGSEISLLWEDDKKIFNNKNYNLVCFNTILSKYPNQKHIQVETFNWLENALKESTASRIITFSYNPIHKSDNSRRFFEITLSYKLFSFVSKVEKTKKEIPDYEGFYLNRNKDWGYLLISVKDDAVLIQKMLGEEIKKKTKPEATKFNFSSTTLYESIKPLKVFSSVNEIWTIELDKTVVSSPALLSDKVIAGFKDGLMLGIDISGQRLWNYETNSEIYIPAVTEREIILTATNEGDIFSLDGNNGNLIQVIGTGETITSEMIVLDIKENNTTSKTFICGTVSGNLYCYNLYTLQPIWIKNHANDLVNSVISTDDNTVIFQDNEGILYCISASNGLLLWLWKSPTKNNSKQLKSNIIENKNSIYLIDARGTLHCIDALLGTSKWDIKNSNFSRIIRINSKGELVIPTSKNSIELVSPKLGKVTSEIKLPTETKGNEITELKIIGVYLLIGFDDGWIYQMKHKQKPEKFFRRGSAPIVSLLEIDGNCLVTDYDGKFTLLNLSLGNK